jgi:hypothetical protein
MIGLWGENMKKGAKRAKVKVHFKDFIFHMAVFYWFKLITKFEAKNDM